MVTVADELRKLKRPPNVAKVNFNISQRALDSVASPGILEEVQRRIDSEGAKLDFDQRTEAVPGWIMEPPLECLAAKARLFSTKGHVTNEECWIEFNTAEAFLGYPA